jgi:hypothetical protein
MDARAFAATALLVAVCPAVAVSATYQTKNFVVTAQSPEFAQQVAEAAEHYRYEIAIMWLGKPLEGDWYHPCPINCKTGHIGAGGATTFTFNDGQVYGWRMNIQGTEQRILDSVLPHEISHMVFACHFRRPLPRWADEGAATLIEHESERMRQTRLLNQVVQTSRRIPLRQLLQIKEYPSDMQDVLTLYAEGYSLADFLVQQKGEQGRATFLAFLGDALDGGWPRAFHKHYAVTNIDQFENEWKGWIMAGSPPLSTAEGTLVANSDISGSAVQRGETVVRGQSVAASTQPSVDLTPLPRLSRPRRELTAAADLAAPEPGSLNLTADDEHLHAEVPTYPVSVQPARPASSPQSGSRHLPWGHRGTPAASPAPGYNGFSDPRFGGAALPQQHFDFSR